MTISNPFKLSWISDKKARVWRRVERSNLFWDWPDWCEDKRGEGIVTVLLSVICKPSRVPATTLAGWQSALFSSQLDQSSAEWPGLEEGPRNIISDLRNILIIPRFDLTGPGVGVSEKSQDGNDEYRTLITQTRPSVEFIWGNQINTCQPPQSSLEF